MNAMESKTARLPAPRDPSLSPTTTASAGTAAATAAVAANDGAVRIDALDGLRAVSILIVLFGHGASTANAPSLLHPLRELGIVGVEIFFAISGFIITQLMLREHSHHGRVDLRQFWLRRALRIVPPFLAAAASIAVIAQLGYITWSWPSFFGALSLSKNTPLFAGDWFFGHTWSLALEEQFYLVWPLLFVFVAAPRRLIAGLSVLLFAAVLITPLTVAFAKPLQNILPFLPHLGAGCLLALLLRERVRPSWFNAYVALPHRGRWLAAFAVATVLVAWRRGEDTQDLRWIPFYAVMVPIATLGLLVEIILPDGRLRQALSLAPLRWLGRISYSLYLWQQIFLGPADVYLQPWMLSSWPWNLLAALVCGALGYTLIEQPMTRLKRRWTTPADASTNARARSNSLRDCRADTTSGTRTTQPAR